MLQDVIDLRSSKWVPRRQDLNPRTMEQIQKEADTEQLNIQVMNSGPMNTPRKDDRLGNVSGDKRRRNNPTDEAGWSMATRGRTPYTVDSSKLSNKPPAVEETILGSKTQFGQWGRGSNIKSQTNAPVTNTANMYAALENINIDEKTRSNYESRFKDSYVSKGPSMERGYKQNYEDGRGSRSGSQHRNSQQRSAPSPVPVKQQLAPTPPAPVPQLTPEMLQTKMKTIIDEYLNDCATLDVCAFEIKQTIKPQDMLEFVKKCYDEVLDFSASARVKMGKLFALLINKQQVLLDDYCNSLTELLSLAEDLVIDIPKLWDYLAEMISPLVIDNALTLDRLALCMEVLRTQGHSHKLLAQLLRQLFTEKGPGYINEIWQTSGVSFTDFMYEDYVNSFIQDNVSFFLFFFCRLC